jgi:hypothetical protein
MKRVLTTLLLTLLPTLAIADLVVVTAKQSTIEALTETEVRQLFSGQLRSINGQRLQPLDLPSRDRNREEFYRKLMGRSPDQMRAYWTRLIFTGQGQPPREVAGTGELNTLISSSTDYVGYLPAAELNPGLKVLFRLR